MNLTEVPPSIFANHLCMGEEAGLGTKIQQLRMLLGLSQSEVARRTDGKVDQTTISRIERGATEEPNVFDVAYIASALGTTVDSLLTEAGITQPEASVLGAETESHSRGEMLETLGKIQGQIDELRIDLEQREQELVQQIERQIEQRVRAALETPTQKRKDERSA